MSLQSSSKVLRALTNSNKQICVNASSSYSTHPQHNQPCIVFMDKERKDRRNTLLGPNKKYPFPGNVTCAATSHAPSTFYAGSGASNTGSNISTSESAKSLTTPAPLMPRSVYATLKAKELVRRLLYPISKSLKYNPVPVEDFVKSSLKVELKIHECPKLLKMDLKNLFESVDLSNRHVTVLNITQKLNGDGEKLETINTMEDEFDRIQLASTFVDAAVAICEGLQLFGYWADFIDPSSGRPYNAQLARTASSMLEFDQRYLQLGFAVENMGLCKVVQNVSWSKDMFVGTIFTDAPVGSEILEKINLEIN